MGTTLFEADVARPADWQVFLATPLGQLYQTIPFRELAAQLPSKKSKAGVKGRFSASGGIGLQVLKHYFKVSDEKLIELVNTDWILQYFCGISIGKDASKWIKDSEVVGRWRNYLGHHLEIDLAQKVLVEAWSDQMEQTQTNLSDATCIESYIRYPTDVKLLGEAIDYLWHQLKGLSRALQLPMLRTKYKEVKEARLAYQKQRRKTHKKRKRIKRRLLALLNKLLEYTPILIGMWKRTELLIPTYPVKQNFFKRLSTIKKVYTQQQQLFDYPGSKVKDRIVSIAKPYLHPIVRGKENKRVEFGMKVNMMQIDGINFFEHSSFSAFHEGIRLKKTIWKHQHYFGKCQQVGADAIYATNANRRYCKQQEIFTCFVPKGRRGKNQEQEQQLRKIIAKERATRLEGSFGTAKNHYLLDKVKARKESTERAWIFFGQFTANAVAMSKKAKPPP